MKKESMMMAGDVGSMPVETELTTFMKLADEVILPILRHNEAKLNDRGYSR